MSNPTPTKNFVIKWKFKDERGVRIFPERKKAEADEFFAWKRGSFGYGEFFSITFCLELGEPEENITSLFEDLPLCRYPGCPGRLMSSTGFCNIHRCRKEGCQKAVSLRLDSNVHRMCSEHQCHCADCLRPRSGPMVFTDFSST
jgi:hypothetical protein